MEIRLLKPNEIDVRVQTIKENGFSLLLYKDARVDMAILDEVFGVFGWERKHEVIDGKLYCTIGIFDTKQGQWVFKQDVGTESYTEKEKGQASDSFKRAAFNIGIGRELYTAPFIWINNSGEVQKGSNGKLYVNGNFSVKEIGYDEDRNINHLVIADSKGNVKFDYKTPQAPPRAEKPKATPHVAKAPKEPVKTTEGTLNCSGCGVEITGKVADYSTEKYGKPLCMKCQKGVK